jgi:hypothetical protein
LCSQTYLLRIALTERDKRPPSYLDVYLSDDDDDEDPGELETDDPDDYNPRDHGSRCHNDEDKDPRPIIQNIVSGVSAPFVSLIWNSIHMKYGYVVYIILQLTVNRDLPRPEPRPAKFHIPPTVRSEADCFHLLIKRTLLNHCTIICDVDTSAAMITKMAESTFENATATPSQREKRRIDDAVARCYHMQQTLEGAATDYPAVATRQTLMFDFSPFCFCHILP